MSEEELAFLEPLPQEKGLEFEGLGGIVLSQLVVRDARELYEFIKANPDLVKSLPQLKNIQTEFDAIEMLRDKRYSTFAIRPQKQAELAGFMTLQQETQNRAAIGYLIGANFRRQGLGQRAVTAMCDNLFKTEYIETVRAHVRTDNVASRNLLERCGFHLQGEQPHVEVFYDIDKADYLSGK